MKTVLTIAGSDPSGGAGLQADLRVCWDLKVRGLSAVTCTTAQNDQRFFSLNPLPSTILREQLRALTGRYRIDAVKIGLLGTQDLAAATFRFLDEAKIPVVVLDTVLHASSGAVLLEPKGVGVLAEFLIPRSTVVTPNLDEAAALTKLPVADVEGMQRAAQRLYEAHPGVKAVLVKGGHLPKRPVDVLYDGREFTRYEAAERLPRSLHGTGCRLSAALAAYLARGEPLQRAVKKAKDYVYRQIASQLPIMARDQA